MHLIRESENYVARANPDNDFVCVRPAYDDWWAFFVGDEARRVCTEFSTAIDPDAYAKKAISRFLSAEGFNDCALYGVPGYMVREMMRYICAGAPMDAFLRAVFAHDDRLIRRYADPLNLQCRVHYMRFLDNHAPAGCHGSWEAVRLWTAQGGGVEWKRESQDSPVDAGGASVDE